MFAAAGNWSRAKATQSTRISSRLLLMKLRRRIRHFAGQRASCPSMQEGGLLPRFHPAFSPTPACFLPNALLLSRRPGKEDDPDHSTHWDWNMSDYTCLLYTS